MIGAVHFHEPIWVNGEAMKPVEVRRNDEAVAWGQNGVRRARLTKVGHGQGKGTVWLHGASGAAIRCLLDERVAVRTDGRRRFRRAEKIHPGDFVYILVGGRLTVDPVVAVRTVPESVPTLIIEMPAVSLISEEGFLCRPA